MTLTFDQALEAMRVAVATLSEVALIELLQLLPAEVTRMQLYTTEDLITIDSSSVAETYSGDRLADLPVVRRALAAGLKDFTEYEVKNSNGYPPLLNVTLLRMVKLDSIPFEWALAHQGSQS